MQLYDACGACCLVQAVNVLHAMYVIQRKLQLKGTASGSRVHRQHSAVLTVYCWSWIFKAAAHCGLHAQSQELVQK